MLFPARTLIPSYTFEWFSIPTYASHREVSISGPQNSRVWTRVMISACCTKLISLISFRRLTSAEDHFLYKNWDASISTGYSSSDWSTIPMKSAFVPNVMVANVVDEMRTPASKTMKSCLLRMIRLKAYPIIRRHC